MYSAAISPPRAPVPRPSSRSWERKRTCQRIFSPSIAFIAANAAGWISGAADAALLFSVAVFCWATTTIAINTSAQAISFLMVLLCEPRDLCMKALYTARDRGLVLAASTSFELRHILAGLEERSWWDPGRLRDFVVEFFDVALRPADTAQVDGT